MKFLDLRKVKWQICRQAVRWVVRIIVNFALSGLVSLSHDQLASLMMIFYDNRNITCSDSCLTHILAFMLTFGLCFVLYL